MRIEKGARLFYGNASLAGSAGGFELGDSLPDLAQGIGGLFQGEGIGNQSRHNFSRIGALCFRGGA